MDKRTVLIAPLEVMQAWPPPNTTNPESQAWKLLATEIPLISVTVIIVVLRVYAKRKYTKIGLGKEDWLIVFSTLLTTLMVAVQCWSTLYGWGIHLWDFVGFPEYLIPGRKLAFATEIFFLLNVNLTKLSILTFYFRLFPLGVPVYLHRLIWIGIAITSMAMIGSLGAAIFQCNPIEHFWNYDMEGYCYPTFPAHLSTAIINSATDFYCVMVPIGEICGLRRVDRKGKIVVATCFALGAIVCVAGIIRIHFTKLVFHDSFDWSWNSIGLYVSAALESTIGIITASIPALRPLITRSAVRETSDVESLSHQKRRSAARKRRRTGTEGPPQLDFLTTAVHPVNTKEEETPISLKREETRTERASESPAWSHRRARSIKFI
ncbi:hypothetical protein ABW19_dt0208845 [Dactylella cylindrospora]|nr:hypothetical protein ABW19_dt0208845 [Dactylella cylindrospora]